MSNKEKRIKQISVKVSDKEHKSILELAERSNLNVSNYVRLVLLNFGEIKIK